MNGMSNSPLVSVIIPVYNRATLISETLDSVIRQTYNNWECLVVDDGSEDGTQDLVEEFCNKDGRIRLVRRFREPKGAPTCRNIGFESSKGSLINWFDSDDIMHEDMITQKVEAVCKEPNYDFVVCRLANFDHDNPDQIEDVSYLLQSNTPFKDYLSFKLRFYTPGPMFKRSFLNKFDQLFIEDLKRNQEGEFFFRALCESSHYQTIEKSLILRRLHNSTIAQQHDLWELSDQRFQHYLLGKYILAYALRNKQMTIMKDFEAFHQLSLRNVRLGIKLNAENLQLAMEQASKVINSHSSQFIASYLLLVLRIRMIKWKFSNN